MGRTKDREIGYGWVGRWKDGSLGWVLPDHMDNQSNRPDTSRSYIPDDCKLEYCRIEIVAKRNILGRPIRRHMARFRGK